MRRTRLAEQRALSRKLKENKAYVTVRGTKMRITPHIYNDDADIARLFELVDRLVR